MPHETLSHSVAGITDSRHIDNLPLGMIYSYYNSTRGHLLACEIAGVERARLLPARQRYEKGAVILRHIVCGNHRPLTLWPRASPFLNLNLSRGRRRPVMLSRPACASLLSTDIRCIFDALPHQTLRSLGAANRSMRNHIY